MPVDASIIAGLHQYKAPTALDVMSLQDLATRSKINQQTLQEKTRSNQQQNALLQLLQSPQAVDLQSGRLTPQALAGITQISPEKGIALEHQQRALTLQDMQFNDKKMQIGRNWEEAYVSSYDRALQQTGGNKEEAIKIATQDRLATIDEQQKNGMLSSAGFTQQEIDRARQQQRDPDQVRAMVTAMGGKVEQPPKLEHVVASNKESSTGLAFFDPRTQTFLKGSDGKIIAAPPSLQATMANATISDEDKKFWADIIRKGGSLPPGLARSGVGAKLVSEVMQEVPKGNTQPADVIANQAELVGIKAGQRTIGTKQAQIEMAVTEAKNMAPLALQASNAVDRTKYPTLNSFLLAAEKGTGDENVVRLGVATNSLINIYARAINPTGVATVSDKDHARELLAAAWSKGQYAAGVDQLMKELAAAQKSPPQVRGAMREALTGKKGEEPAKNDWVERAMKANPGMSREEIEAEGKKRGKL